MGVTIGVLGPMTAWLGDRVLELGGPSERAVLARLAVAGGEVVSTDRLLHDLWSGEPGPRALASLQVRVSRLRRTLEPDRAPRAPARVLVSVGAGYALAADTDAARFTAATTGADSEALRRALALWRGPAYVDVADRAWASAEAARLEERRLAARERLGAALLEAGEPDAAVAELGAHVREHPVREHAADVLARALYQAGRASDALDVLRRTRRHLDGELGLAPGPDLVALETAILRHDAALRPAAAPTPTAVSAVSAVTAVTPDTGLVGRVDELAAVWEAVERAAGGTTRFVVLRGEAGIGKTRLAEEVAARAAAAGRTVVWGRCWQHEGTPPLWPWVQVLRELRRAAPDILAAALIGRGAALAAIVPELAPGTVGQAGQFAHAEVQVLDAALHVLDRCAAERSLLVVLDDLQWADRWSRQLLEFLARQAHTLPLTVLVTVRSADPERGPDPEDDLAVHAALSRSGRLVSVELVGLGVEEVRALVIARTGRELDRPTASALQARTEGNPFYVGEIARLVGDVADPSAVGVPDSVRGVIRRRLAALPPDDVSILSAGALVGRAFDEGLVAAAAAVSEDDVGDAVDRATRAGLLGDEPTDAGEHRFTHALLQETLVDEIGPSRRRRVHHRVAVALAGRRAGGFGRRPSAETVAHHFLAAGGSDDLHTGVGYLLEAADDALRRRSVLEVEPLLDQAAATATRTGVPALIQAVEAHRTAFRLVVRGPDGTSPAEDRTPAPDDGSTRPVDLLVALWTQWGGPMSRAEVGAAERISEEMTLVAAERDDDLLRLGASVASGITQFLRGRFRASAASFEEADRLWPRVAVPPLVFSPHPAVGAPAWRGLALLLLGRDVEARACYAVARPRGRRLDDPIADAYLDVLDHYWWTWHHDLVALLRAGAAARESIDRAGADAVLTPYTLMPRAWAHSHDDLDLGVTEAAEAATVLDDSPGVVFRPQYRSLHGDILLRAARPQEALRAIDRGLDEAARTGATFCDAELHRLRATALAALGASAEDVAAARDRARAVASEQEAALLVARLDEDLRARGR